MKYCVNINFSPCPECDAAFEADFESAAEAEAFAQDQAINAYLEWLNSDEGASEEQALIESIEAEQPAGIEEYDTTSEYLEDHIEDYMYGIVDWTVEQVAECEHTYFCPCQD